MSLSDADIRTFVSDGFVALRGAVSPAVAEACRDELWAATGYDRHDPSTWTQSLVRLPGFGTEPFAAAANAPALTAAFDQLVGTDRWVPRTGLGTFPLRFPSDDAPLEAGWHVEASFETSPGEWRVNVHSRGRGLLMLFLFSEVGPEDAPTLVRVGSHLDVPPLLSSAGEDGVAWLTASLAADKASAARPIASVTGSSGDVYLCHPFVVHSAQAHRGREPRFMAQPPLELHSEFGFAVDDPSPVAQAIRLSLAA